MPPRSSLRAAFADPAYRAALVTNLGNGWVLFGIRSSLIPLFVADVLGRTAFWVGIGFLVGSLTQAAALWPAGRIVDQGRKPAMVGGSVLGVASMALLIGIQTLRGSWSRCCTGIAGLPPVAPAAVVGDVVEGGGRVVALLQMAADVGAVAGPLVGMARRRGQLHAGLGAGRSSSESPVLAARMPETRTDQGLGCALLPRAKDPL